MCQKCGDATHVDSVSLPGRRKVIFQGAVALASLPILGGGSAQAQPKENSLFAAGPGPYSVRAFGNAAATAPFRPLDIKRRAVRPTDVLIDIMYCAVCHSDIHIARQEWGPPYAATRFPCVPGHEIIGRVAAIGSEVTKFRVGDIAGSGAMIDSCGTCENCRADLEQYCLKGWTLNFNSPDPILGGYHYGGFSERVVVPERFAIRIPPGMNLAGSAPLMCAGITTFSPMQHWKLGAGQRVGVIGLGGLGHMAVKLGVARGAQVTVFTTSANKVADARRLGAIDVVVWKDAKAFESFANRFDLLISTVPVPVPTHPLVTTLRLDGTLVIVGAREPIEDVRGSGLWLQRRSVSASLMGGMAETQAFVDYCASRRISADVELIGPDQIDEAFERIKRKDVRFRFVVDFTRDRQAAMV